MWSTTEDNSGTKCGSAVPVQVNPAVTWLTWESSSAHSRTAAWGKISDRPFMEQLRERHSSTDWILRAAMWRPGRNFASIQDMAHRFLLRLLSLPSRRSPLTKRSRTSCSSLTLLRSTSPPWRKTHGEIIKLMRLKSRRIQELARWKWKSVIASGLLASRSSPRSDN